MKRDYIRKTNIVRSGLVSALLPKSFKTRSWRKGQSTMEYLIILVVVLTAILASGFIGRMRGVFDIYFNKAVAEIATEK